MDIGVNEESSRIKLRGRGARRRSPWFLAASALVVVAALLAAVAMHQSSQPAPAPVVEGLPPLVSASGPVVPEKRARLSFTVSGRVKRLSAQPGDHVRQGQALAQLEPSTFQGSLGTITSAGASDLYIVAPFDGVVGLVPVMEWESVQPGTPVVIVGDLSTMRVEIEDMSESDVGRLEVGQRADVTFEAFPGWKVPGRVARISPMNNAKGGGVNYDVVVEFVGRDLPPVRWGMTAHADIHVDESR